MSMLITQVQSRSPVAVVSTYGTLDRNSAARFLVALRDVLADAPSVLIVDVEHLVVGADEALVPLIGLAGEAARWPGADIVLACAGAQTTAALARVPGGSDLRLVADLDSAIADARLIPVAPRRTVTLRPSASAPAESRQFAQEVCAEWSATRLAGLVELVASELVTNAVMHARTPIAVTLRLDGEVLSVAVRDGDPRPMQRPSPGASGAPGEEHGRGLLLLDAMADEWGTSPTADGKVVWATIGIAKPVRTEAETDN